MLTPFPAEPSPEAADRRLIDGHELGGPNIDEPLILGAASGTETFDVQAL
jgi:hypothetical protein